ncbi:MAG: DUF445 family protein [bacterium]
MSYKLIFIPFISALIGWFTNYLAVKMIFRPYKPISLGPIKIQGLIPKRRDEIAVSIGKTVAGHLVSHNDMIKVIRESKIDKSFEVIIDNKLEEFINQRLFAFNPLIKTFVNPEMRNKIKEVIFIEIIDLLPELAEKLAADFERSINVEELVTERIKQFSLPKLEEIILNISSKELKAIEIYGGILGFIIGIFQVVVIIL